MNKMSIRIERLRWLKEIDRKTWIIVIETIIFLGICILYSVSANHDANFYPINGTFQNFNPVRRFLDGQVPYKDFQDYLGLGHLYAGTILTVLFGGDYHASLMAFSFLTFVGAGLISLMVGNAVFKKKEISLALTNLFLVTLIISPLFWENALSGTEDIFRALKAAKDPGNSARFVRGMILPLSYFLFVLGHSIFSRVFIKSKKLNENKKGIALCGTAFIAGFSFAWSNDYGISCWVCLGIMTFIVILAKERKIGKALLGLLLEMVLSLVSLFICVEIFTLGHFPAWFQSVFGTGGYQAWYYNSTKSYYLYDVDFSYIMLIQALFCIIYLWKLFKNNGNKVALIRYGLLAYANMVCFCAVNEYRLLSGNDSREVALTVLFITILFEVCHLAGSLLARERIDVIVMMVSVVVGFAWITSTLQEELIFWKATEKEGIYIEEMGGDVTALATDLEKTTEFLDGEEFFATYASAQEVIADIFQPSGIDYIIHVLGDSQREKYLNTFISGDFAYAATIKESYTHWEYWVQRANWFFYKELYRNWHPKYSNTYEMYWEKNKTEKENTITDDFTVIIVDTDESTKKICVLAEESVNGIADLYIDYEVKRKNNASARLLFQTMLKVKNSGTYYTNELGDESNYLRASGAEYIPVTVVDGYGEVTLTSSPKRSTYLDIYAAKCSDIYTVTFDYVEAQAIADSEEISTVSIVKSAKTLDVLNGISGIVISDVLYEVSEVQSDDTYCYIIIPTGGLAINPDGDILATGNMLQIVK